MNARFLILFITLLFLARQGDAEFGYNKVMPKTPEELDALGLKCIPGRTIMKMGVPESLKNENDTDEDDGEVASDARRTHMHFTTTDETCKICVCSVEGKDEYCSRRPAKNVNECIRMSVLTERLKSSMPFEHERSLSFRIRRDYIWHRDEIPYSPSAKCYRGNSYYTNNPKANDTTIALMMKQESQLDYSSNVCSFCICSTSGDSLACIYRHPWNCEYYRIIRRPNAARDRYRIMFVGDRPAYFRQLSYRLRRTMDDGLIGLLDYVGDDKETSECIPLLSEYTDCSEANICTGCRRCSCTIEGKWSCESVHDCPHVGDEELYDVDSISNAYDVLFDELENKLNPQTVELPAPTEKSRFLDIDEDVKLEQELRHLMFRVKRTVKNKSETKYKSNGTIKFYNTVDELNEDTLKNTTVSGTIEAKKVVGVEIPKISRRTNSVKSKNITGYNDLHIQFSQPKDYDHIVDNKIDSSSHISDKLNLSNHDKIQDLLGNYSQEAKDKDLSKLVVNELKTGSEIIGDRLSAPVSNITFTPENDTLTAMAFIAGNLLSRLWKIEKDSSIESIETEVLKHEKISDLLELFKEPLTMRQEAFIKNALERLSQVVSKESKSKNISLCETLASSEDLLKNLSNVQDKDAKKVEIKCKKNDTSDNKQGNATAEAITKINNVLNLINKYEITQRKLFTQKNGSAAAFPDKDGNDSTFTEDEGKSLNVFGNLLQKITKLILPKKNKISKKMKSKITNLNIFGNSQEVYKDFKEISGFNTNNLTLTFKDKLIMDYLNILKSNPDCSKRIFEGDITDALPNINGYLVHNISQLLKLNSYKEFIKYLQPDNEDRNKFFYTTENVKNIVNEEINNPIENTSNNESKSLSLAKKKLKQHIIAILEDLLEIENHNGFPIKSNISDILPCIHKLLIDGKNKIKEPEKQSKQFDLEKITAVFESLKNSFKYNYPSRRNELINVEMPKSSKVWERVIKNLNKQVMGHSIRRSNGEVPQLIENDLNSFTKLKDMISSVDLSRSAYKKYTELGNVPVASHLILMKVLHASCKEIASILNYIKSFKPVGGVSTEEYFEIQKFVADAARTVNLNEKTFEKIKNSHINNDSNNRNRFEIKKTPNVEYPIRWGEGGGTDHFKVSREQILIQLIRNRIQLYLRLKESKGTKLTHDINYNVARKIMAQLAIGNFSLAKELFSLFLDNTGKAKNRNNLANYFEAPPTAVPASKRNPNESFKSILTNNQYRISDREAQMQESFLKQLIRLKTMNI